MPNPALIAVDWGLSNFRGFLIDRNGKTVDIRRSGLGVLDVENKNFAAAFESLMHDWLADTPPIPVILSGMIGSEQGWSIAPHVPCPVTINHLVQHLHKIEIQSNRNGYIIPGLITRGQTGVNDVMRSEESQIFGTILRSEAKQEILCLPGTHSKWVKVKNQSIKDFKTTMTGETLAVLTRHSILGRLMKERNTLDENTFILGLNRAEEPGGLLHHLFGVRSQAIYGKIGSKKLWSYLSGILISHEIRGIRQIFNELENVKIVGSEQIVKSYMVACDHFGIRANSINGETAAIFGMWHIARSSGLISTE